MRQDEFDQLYSLLRSVAVSSPEDRSAVRLLCSHLLQDGGDYPSLLRWLNYYGARYILPFCASLIQDAVDGATPEGRPLVFNRVVEIGCGLGWLGKGLASKFSATFVGVDNRTPCLWPLDVENSEERLQLVSRLLPGDLIVTSELLHCLKEPILLTKALGPWPWLVVEFSTTNPVLMRSYEHQLETYGARALSRSEIMDLAQHRPYISNPSGPYWIGLFSPAPKRPEQPKRQGRKSEKPTR